MRRNEEFMPVRRGRESDWMAPWRPSEGFGPSFFGHSPWQTMRRMQEDMDRIFGQFFGGQGGFGALAPSGQQAGLQQWAPSVDISQDDREWRIEAELPGVKKDDIDVQVQEGHLVLRAEMRQEEQPQEGQARTGNGGQAQEQQGPQRQYLHRERRYGYFQRVIPLPENADEENIRCEFRDGVLTVHLPKMEQARQQGRRIPIAEGEREPALAGAKGGEAASAEASPAGEGGTGPTRKRK